MIYTITLNPALDKTCVVDVLAINEISRVQQTTVEAGGKGFNVSRALLRADVPSKAIGFVGGSTGEELLSGLQNDGLDVISVPIEGETRVNQVFMTTPSHSIKINAQGPTIQPEEYKQLVKLVAEKTLPQDIWVLSGSLPRNVPASAYAELTKTIHRAGGKVFLDSSGSSFQEGLNAKPYWIKPNLAEARVVFSASLREKDLLDEFRAMGISGTILTLGSRGLMFYGPNELIRVEVPKIENENVVGAGDATVAGFVYGIVNDLPLVECAKWAAAFGCASAHAAENCFGEFREVESYYQKLKVEKLDE